MCPAAAERAHPRLRHALALAFLWHGGLLVSGSYRLTYDAYIHMFFGDHYGRDWFSTWEQRWYTGFTVTSYPPGTHQLMGALSRFIDLEAAFVIVQLSAILLLVTGVYRFSKLWVSTEAAGWAALLTVLSTSLAEVVHVFGQLPTTASLAMLLNTLPSVYAWVARSDRVQLVVAIAGMAATTALHHVTTLFGAVFFVGPVVALALFDELARPRPDEPVGHSVRLARGSVRAALARRVRRVLPAIFRAGIIGFASIAVLVTVVLPYWLWSSSDPIVQIPIPHATRDNFLENGAAGLVFFVVPWGLTVFALPIVLVRGLFSRAVPLAASVGLLFILGTGGTTPIPRLLLRGAFDILTLDRFTVWATVSILPLLGSLADSAVHGGIARFGRAIVGRRLWSAGGVLVAVAVLITGGFAANFARFRPLQPDRIDPEPIAEFMAKDQHDRWRYLTLGFGDQMAIVSARTTATTVDGNYHSARRLPELTSRSVERLEGAKFRGVPGIGSLQQFLATPETYNLKFTFSNDDFYDPLLWASGWHRLERLRNGIVVWEREDIPPLPADPVTRELPIWQRAMWGVLPMSALASAAVAFSWFAAGAPVPASIRRRLTIGLPKVWVRLDRWLADTAASVPVDPHRRGFIERQQQRFDALADAWSRPSERTARRVRMATGLCIAGLVGAAGLLALTGGPARLGPDEVVTSYYDDLDFRRVQSAWGRLDPTTRPTFAQFELERSVNDGLVAGFGKLDRIETEVVSTQGNRAVVRADMTWITALREYDRSIVHELRNVEGGWHLVPEPGDPSTTPDQFARDTEVAWLSQGRRQITTEESLFSDVLDRPRIDIVSARVVRADDRWSVVGEMTNVEVDPADITLTARFLDQDEEVLVEHNAALVTIHKVLPRETVPFRVDVEAISGAFDPAAPEAGDFHPELFAAPRLDVADIARVELSVRAVVTGRDLVRPLQLADVTFEPGPNGQPRLVGELRNGGNRTATVPHVLVALRDESGEVAWVTDAWVDTAVRPQRRVPIDLPVTIPEGLTAIDVPVDTFDEAPRLGEEVPTTFAPPIDLPAEGDYATASVSVHSFQRVTS